jgi:hypothetical protein
MKRSSLLESVTQFFSSSRTKGPSLVLNIPADLFAQLLTEWLQLGSIVKLDSAFCNTSARTDFLSAAYGEDFTFLVSDGEPRYERCLSWCLTRNVKVDGIFVRPKVMKGGLNHEFKQFLSAMGPRLRWAVVNIQNTDCMFAVLDVVRWCPNIQRLKVQAARSNDDATTTLWEECLLTVARSCQHLCALNLTDVPLSTTGLTKVLGYCGKLSQLTIGSWGSTLPPEVAVSSLSYLDIRYCDNATDALMLAIAKNCPTLQSLFAFYESTITDIGVLAVLQGCPLLRETDVEYATGISRELRTELARRVRFTELSFDDTSKWIDLDEGMLQSLLLVCPALTRLSISAPPWFTDAALALCAHHCPQLAELIMFNCHGLTVAGVLHFLKPGSNLRSIHLDRCPKPADELVRAAAEHCPQLQALLIYDTDVSDAAVAVLAKQCTRIHTLSLVDCFGVTMTGVRALAEHCSELGTLSLPTSLDGQSLPYFHHVRSPVIVKGARMIGNRTCVGSYEVSTRWEALQRDWKWMLGVFFLLCGVLLAMLATVEWLGLRTVLDWRWYVGVFCLSFMWGTTSDRFKGKSL